MLKKILFVTATALESEALKKVKGIKNEGNNYRLGYCEIHLLIAGVGPVFTMYNIMKWLEYNGRPDLAVNAGIAGTFSTKYKPGDILIVRNDCFADIGIEDGDEFYSLAEKGLAAPDDFPFRDGRIDADEKYIKLLERNFTPVDAITVNTATGSDQTCRRLIEKFNPSLETMEGASFFYICRRENIPFFAVRAVSNRVEPKGRHKWQIEPALDNLSIKLSEIFLMLD